MYKLLTLALFLISFTSAASTITYICSYQLYSNLEGIQKVSDDFGMSFIIDIEAEKAYILGNQGSEEVTPIANKLGGISFIEVTEAGNVMTTTITATGDSVHSRNTTLSGELVPSQYYGKCEMK